MHNIWETNEQKTELFRRKKQTTIKNNYIQWIEWTKQMGWAMANRSDITYNLLAVYYQCISSFDRTVCIDQHKKL